MAVQQVDKHLQSVGASFALRYYTTLVEAPATLATLYTPSANVVHCFRKANGAAELSSLLTALTAEGLTAVAIKELTATRTASGAVKVAVKGLFRISAAAAELPFAQEVELRELAKDTFGIVEDKLTYSASKTSASANGVSEKKGAAAAVETPAVAPETAGEAAGQLPAADAEAVAAKAEEVTAAPAVAVPEAKPTSFAEALRREKAGSGAAFSNQAVRVTDKVKPPAKKEKAATGKSAAPQEVKKPAHTGNAAPVIYYDVILKELPTTVTEADVRACVTPVAEVRLVNIIQSEKRRRGKEGASERITFAFVQLERPADAPATFVQDVVAKLTEANREMHIEQVHEKKLPANAAKKATAAPPRAAKEPKEAPKKVMKA